MSAAIEFLVLPSVVVLFLLVLHSLKNRGVRSTLIYFGLAIIYGALRATVIQNLIEKQYGSLFPYLMTFPVIKIGPVSMQELVGWGVAATVAWLIADRLLIRLRITQAPHRTALIAAFCLAAICLAVETAAIEAGWWVWTIKQPQGLFGKVPLVGLLDWAFVAFDFLLPYLLFVTPSPILPRILSLFLFPLHFYFHPKVQPFPEPLPLAPNDLLHGAIFCYVLIQSIGEKGSSALPDPQIEKLRWIPLISGLLIATATSMAILTQGHSMAAVGATVPLILMTLSAFAFPFSAYLQNTTKSVEIKHEIGKPASQRKGKSKKKKKQLVSATESQKIPTTANKKLRDFTILRVIAVLAVFAFVYFFRVPFHRRTQTFTEMMQHGIQLYNAGSLEAAETEFKKGIEARPDQAGGRAILAHLLVREGKTEEARKQLHTALDLNQTQQTALILVTTLDLMDKKWEAASKRAAFGHKLYPNRPEFIYQQGVAEHQTQKIGEALNIARQGGKEMLQALALVAQTIGDQTTVQACMKQISEK
jgi:hypothetical protein